MKQQDKIHIDHLFTEKLVNLVADYEVGDWEALENELNKKNRINFWPILVSIYIITLKYKTIIMSTILTGSVLLLVSIFNGTDINNKVEHNTAKKNIIVDNPSSSPLITKLSSKEEEVIKVLYTKNELLKSEPIMPLQLNTKYLNFKDIKLVPKDSGKISSKADKVAKELIKKTWVEPKYEWTRVKHNGPISQAWIGLHYTQMGETFNNENNSHGMNIQLMSGNLIKIKDIALYGGFDWGFQANGRSTKKEVILNTINNDLGYTYLSSSTHDFLLRAHLEYAKGAIMPYINLAAGPRVHFTGQTVGMYNAPVDVEPTSRENVHSNTSFVVQAGAGLRLRLTDFASLDLRYEIVQGEDRNMVDLDRSNLIGTAYSLNYIPKLNNHNAFKVGLIFDLSSSKHEKVKVKDGYYKETKETYYVDPEDANKIIVTCDPCNENRSSNSYRPQHRNEGIDNIFNGNGDGRGNNSWGGGKSPTPSIKSPVIRH